jgi:hypothetical protein
MRHEGEKNENEEEVVYLEEHLSDHCRGPARQLAYRPGPRQPAQERFHTVAVFHFEVVI